MPCKFVPAIIIILLLNQSLTAQQQDGSVLGRRITILAYNQPVSVILDQISWQAKVHFSYNSSIIETSGVHSIEAYDKSLYTILHSLFKPNEFKLNELENQIIISSRKTDSNTTNIPDSIEEPFYFLSGKVVDIKKLHPLTFATVSLLNKPIGTITNEDGEFLLKIHPKYITDTLVVSSMGYSRYYIQANHLLDQDMIAMEPVSIRLREVNITAINPHRLLENIRENLPNNYAEDTRLMEAFYRETVKQDDGYISISEAVTEILKAPSNSPRMDLTRLIKGRQSPEVQSFKWLNFKLQGGPFTITKLDVVKTMESFLEKEKEHMYKYKIPKMILYHDRPIYVLEFEPVSSNDPEGFIGELYVDRETFALIHARYEYSRNALKYITPSLVRSTPQGVKARPTFVEYQVSYQMVDGKWYLATAKASLTFRIRSRKHKLNSEFKSASELLITNIQKTEMNRFKKDEIFSSKDIFVELINSYDAGFWQNYNIIKPDEDLKNAIPEISADF